VSNRRAESEPRLPVAAYAQDRRARVAPLPDRAVVKVARVTEPPLPDIRVTRTDAQRDDARTGVRYLPSARVLAELASLGPDLRRLAEDLRDRLTGPTRRPD
jgi:hypothetical protein